MMNWLIATGLGIALALPAAAAPPTSRTPT
jgi:hypothetical protein